MPPELVLGLSDSAGFNEGFGTTEYLAAALLDQAWHRLSAAEAAAVTVRRGLRASGAGRRRHRRRGRAAALLVDVLRAHVLGRVRRRVLRVHLVRGARRRHGGVVPRPRRARPCSWSTLRHDACSGSAGRRTRSRPTGTSAAATPRSARCCGAAGWSRRGGAGTAYRTTKVTPNRAAALFGATWLCAALPRRRRTAPHERRRPAPIIGAGLRAEDDGAGYADFSTRLARGPRHDRRRRVLEHGLAGDHHAGDVVVGRDVEHHRAEDLFDDRAEPAGTGLAQHREVGDRLERALVELELDAVDLEHPLVLLDQGVLRLGQDLA